MDEVIVHVQAWVNVYKKINEDVIVISDNIYYDKADALKDKDTVYPCSHPCHKLKYVKTIKIHEWIEVDDETEL